MILEGWRRHRALGRTLLLAFYLCMGFAAVYLDHHWVLDALLGSLYAILASLIMRLPARVLALDLVDDRGERRVVDPARGVHPGEHDVARTVHPLPLRARGDPPGDAPGRRR